MGHLLMPLGGKFIAVLLIVLIPVYEEALVAAKRGLPEAAFPIGT